MRLCDELERGQAAWHREHGGQDYARGGQYRTLANSVVHCPNPGGNCPTSDEWNSRNGGGSSGGQGAGCFSADATVRRGGVTCTMDEVNIGDKVSVLSKDGHVGESEIYCFAHRDEDAIATFVLIRSASCTIPCTPDHLIPLMQDESTVYVHAAKVVVGYKVISHGTDGVARVETVQRIERVMKRGLFAPVTFEGTLFVDGIAASCYAVLRSHTLCHIAMAPMRWAYFLNPSVIIKTHGMLNLLKGAHMYIELCSMFAPAVKALGI